MTVPLLTLDTSCVSAVANPSKSNSPVTEVAAIEKILEMASNGLVQLQLTTAYERDFDRWNNPGGRAERLAWLERAPVLTIRAPGVFRLNVSVLTGEDGLAGRGEADLDKALRSILPGDYTVPGNDPARDFSDIDHLLAHHLSGASMFVTLDQKTILSKRDQLGEIGIAVGLPTEALACLES